MEDETVEQYIHRMTGTKGKIFTPTGWISVQKYTYRNQKMLFIECYTDCIYKAKQSIARFWMKPMTAVHLAWKLLDISQIWNKQNRRKSNAK